MITTKFEDWEEHQMEDPAFRAAAEEAEPGYQRMRIRQYQTHIFKLNTEVGRLREVALAYEEWEADLILNADWTNVTPRLTQTQWDRLVEIQAMRNSALKEDGT